ncbi:MAG: hypothetical protein E6K61_04305 [Nitrospirae bacterium]|nr:MAG: hypothetical protein E6K61_04305 [Nitrospirota bacterium]
MVRAMLLAGVLGLTLFLALVLGDWFHFTSLTAAASRYGCGIARLDDRLPLTPFTFVIERFDRDGLLRLPHGVARVFLEQRRILLRPQYQFFSLRLRTAWPLNGSIDLEPDGDATCLTCIKRVPWSSALLTLLWFAVVGLGTVGFVIAYLAEGGPMSLSGALMGLGITGLGFLVLAFGVLTVALAVRLEDHRLTQAYHELRAALAREPAPSR